MADLPLKVLRSGELADAWFTFSYTPLRAEDAGIHGIYCAVQDTTEGVLAFSRRQTLDPKPTGVNRLIRGMEDLIYLEIGPGITLEVVGAAGLWTASIDAGQRENALLNLCVNARDAMPCQKAEG